MHWAIQTPLLVAGGMNALASMMPPTQAAVHACRSAYTASLTVFACFFAILIAICRCGPNPAIATPTGLVSAILYGLSIIYGQQTWPADRLYDKASTAPHRVFPCLQECFRA